MARAMRLQVQLPRFEVDGVTHRRDCECPRCEAGYRPSEGERDIATRSWETRERLRKAADALARKEERRRVKALAVKLEIEQAARRTAARLRAQSALLAQLSDDERLRALLASRRAGLSAEEAVAEVERRFGPHAAERGR